METDDGRARVHQYREHLCIVSKALVDCPQCGRRRGVEFGEQRRKPFQP